MNQALGRAGQTVVLAIVALCGCGTHPEAWRKVDLAELAAPGVQIEAKDQSFRLAPGQAFTTPFWAHDCPGLPTPENAPLGRKLGGQPVWVHYPGHEKPLHGILSFCRIHPSVVGPVARMYSLRIPESYIAATDGGRRSVVFEPSGYWVPYEDGSQNVPAWVLWLSELPFPGEAQ